MEPALVVDSGVNSPSFSAATLRSERTRVVVMLGVFATLFVLVAIRGGISIVAGLHGEALPFAALLGVAIAYEAVWLRYVDRAIASTATVPARTWISSLFVESLVPTAALFLEIQTSFIGPGRALTSPVLLVYFLLIILSALHLNPVFCRLAGVFSALGYSAFAVYVAVEHTDAIAGAEFYLYGAVFSSAILLLVAGFTAGAVAAQIRKYVLAALRDAENQARIAELKHDLDLARSIQQGLLPKEPPNIDGFDIAGWNKPADETGGDYYDWQELPGGRAAITVADVTGHGIASALCMAACRSYARAGFYTQADLRTFLCRLNELLHQDLPAEKFVTLAAGRLNPDARILEFISAGHGPLVFYDCANDRFHNYDAQGLPLGLLPSAPYGGPQQVNFRPGDIFVIVTDGLIEWANAQDEDFGQDRLEQVIRENHRKPSASIISELYSAVIKFAAGTPQRDDLTALVVKCV